MAIYETVESIKIDGFAPGMWRNSVIISADFDIGFGDKPSKFVINVINTTGDYVDEEKNLSYLDPHDIDYGPFRFRFYLESFQFQKAAGQRKLQLTFVDGSTVLDRIYVALSDKDATIDDQAVYHTEAYFPILCDAPEFYPPQWATNGLVNQSKVTMFPVKDASLDPWSILRDMNSLEKGGQLTIGWTQPSLENFNHDCNNEDAVYNFCHLLWNIQRFGINVKGDFLQYDANGNVLLDKWGGPLYRDRNPFHYKSIGGVTLRDCLNQWCEIQGFSWFYDFQTNAIVGVDEYTQSSVTKYEEVRKIIGTLSENGYVSEDADGNRIDLLVENSSETVTLAGTKKKFVNTKALRNAKPDNPTNYDYYRPIKFYPLDISHIIPANQRGSITGLANKFRSDTQFRISCGLAKYSESGGQSYAREIFNCAIGCHEANGIQIIGELDLLNHPGISGNPMAQLAIQAINMACVGAAGGNGAGNQLLMTLNQWVQFQKIPFKVYFARYSSDLEAKFYNWERQIAESFLGRFYLNFDFMHNFERCHTGGLGVFRRTDVTSPHSEIFKRLDVASGKKAYPWATKQIVKDPYGLRVNSNLFGVNPLTGVALHNQFNILTRNEAQFETSQQEYDDLIKPGNQAKSLLEQWQPIFIESPASGGGNTNLASACSWISQLFPHLNVFNGMTNVVNWPANMFTGQTMMNAASIMNSLWMQNNNALPNAPKMGIYIHPDYSHPNFPFKIKNVSYTKYINTKEKSIEYNDHGMSQSWGDSCPLACGGISPRQVACDGLMNRYKSRPWPTGIERMNMGNLVQPMWAIPAFGFQMEMWIPPMAQNQNWDSKTTSIVYPSWSSYIVNQKTNIMRRVLQPKVNSIYNGIAESYSNGIHGIGNVSKVEVVDNDISPLLNPVDGSHIKVYGWNNQWAQWNLGGQFWRPPPEGQIDWTDVKVANMHQHYVINSEIPTVNAVYGVPRKRITATIGGMNFGSLAPYCHPSFGLESVSVRMTSEGIATEVSFSNKPPKELGFEMTHRNIKPDLIRHGGLYPMY
jgi:hypothetical protein